GASDVVVDAGPSDEVGDSDSKSDMVADARPVAMLPLYSCGDATGPIPALTTEVVAQGLTNPVGLEAALNDPSRLYIVEKGGKGRLVKNGVLVDRPFLDISGITWAEVEAGLLGLAFHPDYVKNGRFWAYF